MDDNSDGRGTPDASSAAPFVFRWQHPVQSTSLRMLPWPHAQPGLPSRHPADTSGAATRTPTYSPNPQSNLRVNPRDCRKWAARRHPAAMKIPYRGLGLITLVKMTHDTSR